MGDLHSVLNLNASYIAAPLVYLSSSVNALGKSDKQHPNKLIINEQLLQNAFVVHSK